jgi:DNA-binding PadR family transcriptional regulator
MIYLNMSMPPSNPPLGRPALLILLALADGEKHGYAIMRDARDLSEGQLSLGPATLYTTLQRLLESDWIAEVDGPEESDARRRYYGLTRKGKSVLTAELQQMESLLKKSRALRLRPSGSAS